VVLPLFLVPTLALHLSSLCEHLTRGVQYRCKEMSFRMQTVAEYSARNALDRTSHHPQATRIRAPASKSHHTGKSAGTLQAGRKRRVSVRA